MISGRDRVLIGAGEPGPAISRMLDNWITRWPELRISCDGTSDGEYLGWSEVRALVSPAKDNLLVARDEKMVVDWEEYGYDLPNDTEGPFAVLYGPCRADNFLATLDTDPYDRDFGFERYGVTVAGAGLYLLTVVTPDIGDEFSDAVHSSILTELSRTEDQR